jgi:hypothetical protein
LQGIPPQIPFSTAGNYIHRTLIKY